MAAVSAAAEAAAEAAEARAAAAAAEARAAGAYTRPRFSSTLRTFRGMRWVALDFSDSNGSG